MSIYEPLVVLVLPLDGKDPRYDIKNAIAKAESVLLSTHRIEDATPVIRRLHHLARNINFPPQRSSAALFVSGKVEKICYMAMKVEPQVIIDEPFRVRDLARCKRRDAEFIALVINGKQAQIYHGYKHPLRLVPIHRPEKLYTWLNEVPEKTGNFSDPDDRHETMLDKFLRHIDADLGEILNTSPLPVFVIGAERTIGIIQPATGEDAEVCGHCVLRYVELTGDFARSQAMRFVPHQQAEHVEACSLCERAER